MRKVVSHVIITLDGVANFDTTQDAIMQLRRSPEVLDDFFEKLGEEDSMILGRKTYEEWSNYWPASNYKPFASHVNYVPKYVASKTLESVPWAEFGTAELIRGDLAEAVAGLKRMPGKSIGVHGSPTLVGAMLQLGLIDELRLEVYPVIAGAGPRLFQDRGSVQTISLASSKITSNGVAILTYDLTG